MAGVDCHSDDPLSVAEGAALEQDAVVVEREFLSILELEVARK